MGKVLSSEAHCKECYRRTLWFHGSPADYERYRNKPRGCCSSCYSDGAVENICENPYSTVRCKHCYEFYDPYTGVYCNECYKKMCDKREIRKKKEELMKLRQKELERKAAEAKQKKLDEDKRRRERQRKAREDAKLSNIARKNFNYAADVLGEYGVKALDKIKETAQDPEVQAGIKYVGQKTKDGVSSAAKTMYDTVTNPEFQQSMVNTGTWGINTLWSGGKTLYNYAMGGDKTDDNDESKESEECEKPEVLLSDYFISYISWRVEPISNFAKYGGGKHTKIYVEFKVDEQKTKWPFPAIAFAVERHQNGVFIVSRKDVQFRNNKDLDTLDHDEDNLKEISLKDFLTKLTHKEGKKKKPYKLDTADCHCLAESLWKYCSNKISPEKPNKLLTSIGSPINFKLPKNGKGTFGQMSVQKLDPLKKPKDGETANDVEKNILDILNKWYS